VSGSEPVRVLVALGSNLGDRRAQLEGALAALAAADAVEVLRVSPWIETRAEGGPAGQPDFLNGVLEARTTLCAADLLWLLQRIETQFGRDRRAEPPQGPRTLDLDLLFYGDEVIEESGLVVPHPRLEERTFVLEPMSHLEPERVLPRCGRTVRERLLELERARSRSPR
jgi:2-amino-4-hydroxy-6-hydroxymethyldihydropteridine diphosphokinase